MGQRRLAGAQAAFGCPGRMLPARQATSAEWTRGRGPDVPHATWQAAIDQIVRDRG